MNNSFRKITITSYPNLYRGGDSVGVLDKSVQEITINTNQILYIRKYDDYSSVSLIEMVKKNCYFYALHTPEELMEIINGT